MSTFGFNMHMYTCTYMHTNMYAWTCLLTHKMQRNRRYQDGLMTRAPQNLVYRNQHLIIVLDGGGQVYVCEHVTRYRWKMFSNSSLCISSFIYSLKPPCIYTMCFDHVHPPAPPPTSTYHFIPHLPPNLRPSFSIIVDKPLSSVSAHECEATHQSMGNLSVATNIAQ